MSKYIICIESSKTRGMGHLFRTLLYTEYLKRHMIPFVILINNDANAIDILKRNDLSYNIVDFSDYTSDWETKYIQKEGATVWVEDKFESSQELVCHVAKNKDVLFCMIDEFGDYAYYSDLHFAGMMYPSKQHAEGKKTFCGPEYIVLNAEVDENKRLRHEVEKIIVTLGGSDPFGVTVDVVRELCKYDYDTEVVIGPSFDYSKELGVVNKKGYPIKQYLPSLISEFKDYDFAITGGGGTPCEANASGLPCMVIANAPHETNTGRYLEDVGGCIYAGDHDSWDRSLIGRIDMLDIEKMSSIGMSTFRTGAVDRIFDTIEVYRNSRELMRDLRGCME